MGKKERESRGERRYTQKRKSFWEGIDRRMEHPRARYDRGGRRRNCDRSSLDFTFGWDLGWEIWKEDDIDYLAGLD